MKSLLKTKSFLSVVVGAGILAVVVVYQNCGSGGGSFDLNSQNNTSQSINLSTAALSLNSSIFTPSQTIVASAQVNGTGGTYNCQWMFVTNPGGSVVPPSITSTTSSNSVCSVSTAAPSAVGGYSLVLSATMGSVMAAPVAAAFSVSANSTPTPTPTATPTPTPTPTPTATPTATPKPSPTPFSPGYYCTCNSGPPPVCAGVDLSGQTCYLGGDTWNCQHCANYCSTNPFSCR